MTDERFGAAHPLRRPTRACESISRPPAAAGDHRFIGRTRDGDTTTLGRGGSDFSAAILGAALGAERSKSGPTRAA